MADKLTALLAATVRDIAAISDAAYEDLMQQIADGTDPRLATERVLVQFRGDYVTQLSEAFSTVLERRVTVGNILHIPVGGVFLSQTLYLHIRQTSLEVAAVVRLHAQGLQSASRLARLLYDGYDPKDGIQRPLEGVARAQLPKGLRELTADPAARQSLQAIYTRLQQAASRTKSEALRASYMEMLEAWKKGAGQDVLDKKLWVAEREKTRNMAERIAVTELARAHNTKLAREIMADESVEVVEIRLNPRHPKPDICDIHATVNAYGLGAGVYPKAVGPRPPFHPRCLPGTAQVSAGSGIAAVAMRRYDGDMVIITVASGKRIESTPNHPILTPSGWVEAGGINVGDNVICRVDTERMEVSDYYHQNVPTSIAKVFDTFCSPSEMLTIEVPTSPEDFHGDGMAGEVAVIRANSKLWNGPDTAIGQGIGNSLLVVTHDAERLPPYCGINKASEGANAALACGVSGHDHVGPLLGSLFGEADNLLFAGSSHNVSTGLNSINDGGAADAKLARKLQDGFSGSVFADKVVDVNVVKFSGHVYNLETLAGHYTCNGIITHNCWCRATTRPDLSAEGAKLNSDAVRQYLGSLPPATAASVLGSRERLEAVMGGKDWEAVTQASIRPEYRLGRIGDPSKPPVQGGFEY